MPKSLSKPMKWTATQEQALRLTFEGRWTHQEIAAKCSVSVRAYRYWIVTPDFQARLDALRADLALALRDVVYADKSRRVMALDAMAESARREYEARPLLKEMRPTPDGMLVQEAFNAAAHNAFRGALDDIAKELGQRTAKADASAQIALIAVAGDVLDAI